MVQQRPWWYYIHYTEFYRHSLGCTLIEFICTVLKIGFQRGDGAFGPIIVREPKKTNVHVKLYDFDLTEHVISLNDWAHEIGVSMFTAHHHSLGDNKPPNILCNGKGRVYEKESQNFDQMHSKNITSLSVEEMFKNRKSVLKVSDESKRMPLADFIVEKNFKYRFRLINAGFLNCPIGLYFQIITY